MRYLVDRLCLSLIFRFKHDTPKEIIYLDPAKKRYQLLFSVLVLFGIRVQELTFKLGDLEKSQDSSLYIKAIKLVDLISTELSKKAVENNYLYKINNEFGRNTIQLRLAKCYMKELLPFCLKVVLLQENREAYKRLYIQKPYLLSWEYVESSDHFGGLNFYSRPFTDLKSLSSVFIQYFKAIIASFYVRLRSHVETIELPSSDATYIILSLKEDSISSDQSHRNQQFWIEGAVADYTYYVLDLSWKLNQFSSVKTFGKTYSLPIGMVGLALRMHSHDPRLKKLSQLQVKSFLRVIFTGNLSSIFAFLNILIQFKKSIEISSLALLLNANKYVFKETHGVHSDAIQLISRDLGITTYAIQYSNLSQKNCNMYSTADKYLLFSDMYKNTFRNECFVPGEFITTGYPYREVINYVKRPAWELRNALHDLGVNLIIGYFDESDNPGKYSLTDREHHHYAASKLANLVLSNKKIAVIVKSQFILHSTSSKYSLDEQIQEALNTGRFIDLCHGSGLRNDVYPTEVGLASDICVGDMVGGTASLEVALSGNRSAIINPYNIYPPWKNLLLDKDIVFTDLDHFLKEIKILEKINIKSTNIGDWSSIISEFDPYLDEFSFERIQNTILQKSV